MMTRRFVADALLIALLTCIAANGAAMAKEVRRGKAKHADAKAVQGKNQADPPPPAVTPPALAVTPAPAALAAVGNVSPIAAPTPTPPACDEACQQGRRELSIQLKFAWFGGGLLLVGCLQALTMIWQGVLLRRTRDEAYKQAGWIETQAGSLKEQAEILKESVAAAQTSADVAMRQIRHAVASERPWMDVQMSQKDLNYSQLKFVARNRGSSPAKVTMYTVEKVVVSTEDAHSGPKYGNNGGFAEPQWRLTGDEFIVGEFQLPANLPHEVQQPGVSVLYQGFIRYNDTVTEDAHETRFCYEAFLQGDGPVRFRMLNAKGYNTMS